MKRVLEKIIEARQKKSWVFFIRFTVGQIILLSFLGVYTSIFMQHIEAVKVGTGIVLMRQIEDTILVSFLVATVIVLFDLLCELLLKKDGDKTKRK